MHFIQFIEVYKFVYYVCIFYKTKQTFMEIFDSNAYVSRYSEDARSLIFLGRYIKRNGLRKGFDEAITDFNLGRHLRQGMPTPKPHQISRMRELTEYLDFEIPHGLVEPRLEILYKLIIKLNK